MIWLSSFERKELNEKNLKEIKSQCRLLKDIDKNISFWVDECKGYIWMDNRKYVAMVAVSNLGNYKYIHAISLNEKYEKNLYVYEQVIEAATLDLGAMYTNIPNNIKIVNMFKNTGFEIISKDNVSKSVLMRWVKPYKDKANIAGKSKAIFIILTHDSKQYFPKYVSAVTKSLWNHANISFSETFDKVFTFTAEIDKITNRLHGGMKMMEKKDFMKKYTGKTVQIEILCIMVSNDIYTKVQEQIICIQNNDPDHDNDMMPLLLDKLNIQVDTDNGFTCSSFIAAAFRNAGLDIIDKDNINAASPADLSNLRYKDGVYRLYVGLGGRFSTTTINNRLNYIMNNSSLLYEENINELSINSASNFRDALVNLANLKQHTTDIKKTIFLSSCTCADLSDSFINKAQKYSDPESAEIIKSDKKWWIENCKGFIFMRGNRYVGMIVVDTENNEIIFVGINPDLNLNGVDVLHQLIDIATIDLNARYIKISRSNNLFKNIGMKDILIECGYEGKYIDSNNRMVFEYIKTSKSKISEKVYPLYIILSYGDAPHSRLIANHTHSMWSHAAMSFDPLLNHMYSYGIRGNHTGFIDEPVSAYCKDTKFSPIEVLCIFLSEDIYISIKDKVSDFIDNIGNTKYDPGTIYRFIIDKTGIEPGKKYNRVCSTFIADCLKNSGAKIFDEAISNYSDISPADLSDFNTNPKISKYVYKVWYGLSENYDKNQISNVRRRVTKLSKICNIIK